MSLLRDIGEAILDRGYQTRQHVRHFFGRARAHRYPGGGLAPVLLLPGVYETWQFLRPVADRVHALGHPVHILTELGYNRLSIAESAAVAQRYLVENDLRGVILIGHSKGGLIGKHMMVTDDVDGRIDRMVTLNTPFGGSSLARYSPIRTLRAFSPHDETLMTLAANLAANARITSIYSRLDPIIPSGSRLEGATNVELPMVGHFRPLGSRQLFDAIEAALGS